MAGPMRLAPVRGVHRPDYRIALFREGDPGRPVGGVDLRSARAIQTSKDVNDLSGTFSITFKDRSIRQAVRSMDAGRIQMRGHYSDQLSTVLKVVVDEVRPARFSDPYASSQDTMVTGRCIAKYAQVTSLFLPVWDPEANLPTALTFGYGDATAKTGHTPYAINRYIVNRFCFGNSDQVGISGIPAAAHWLDYSTRFARELGFNVPFLQFDETSVADAFKTLEVLGFTEAWFDELGRQVYRQPQWDAPVSYTISTDEFINDSYSDSDIELSTYVEVIPAGDPGIGIGAQQALRAGRAPVPSAYLKGKDAEKLRQAVSPEFIIETDRKGKVTDDGAKNPWYQLQRRYGLRPQQISSPLIFTQAQAQAQAEGLLRFYARQTKTLSATIPGCPELRLGRNLRAHGMMGGGRIDRTYYLEQISHSYVEDQGYTTSFTGTHGRDPSDPKWKSMVLPTFDPSELAKSDKGGIFTSYDVSTGPSITIAGTLRAKDLTGLTPKDVIDQIFLPIGRAHGLLSVYGGGTPLTPANVYAANQVHGPTESGSRSDHEGPPSVAWAADMGNGRTTHAEDVVADIFAEMLGIPISSAATDRYVFGATDRYIGPFKFQLGYRTYSGGDHYNHIHIGCHQT